MSTLLQTPEITRLLKLLRAAYPDPECELNHRNAFELLAATILSAQCTDKRVNIVTPDLFARYPDPAALAGAAPDDVEALIRTTGFYRNKAKNLIGMAQALCAQHNGQVPNTLACLIALPGVARKTANVVLGVCFKKAEGVVVDTHVMRLAQRLGLTQASDPIRIERELMQKIPKARWIALSHELILHGRRVCNARKPACEACTLSGLCPSAFQITAASARKTKIKRAKST
jgi:endonuclease-3